MRDFDTATAAYFQGRAGTCVRILFWAEALNRSTGLTETVGLWNGVEDRVFTIGGGTRTYFGAGAVIGMDALVLQTGLAVRMQRMTLSPLSPAVITMIRTYDARFAPVQIHRALFSTDDGALIAEPHRLYDGFIDTIDITTPKEGEDATCELTLASSARRLTQTLALKTSDATQRLRSDDRFRRYVDVSGVVDYWWGERRPNQRAARPAPGGSSLLNGLPAIGGFLR
jgi:hypothetical protein